MRYRLPAARVTAPVAALALLAAVLRPTPGAAQAAATPDLSRVQLGVLFDDASAARFPDGGNALARKFTVALAAEQMGAVVDGLPTQFRLHVMVTPLTEEVVPGAPPMVLAKATIDAIVEDSASRQRLASWSGEGRGTGRTPAQAWASLAGGFRPAGTFAQMLRQANDRIVASYESRCADMIAQTDKLIARKDFDAAIYLLETVPEAAAKCRRQANDVVVGIVGERTEYLCGAVLAGAKRRWAADKSREGAERIADQLEDIDGSAPCYGDVEALLGEVAKKIGEYDEKEEKRLEDAIAFEKKQYEDRVALTREAMGAAERVETAKANATAQGSKMALDVAKDVSLAYAKFLSGDKGKDGKDGKGADAKPPEPAAPKPPVR